MLKITSIKDGIVIDHIKAGYGMNIFKYLKLDEAKCRVALIINTKSNKLGKKDMIKIENTMNIDVKALGLIDPNITIDFIKDEKIIKKLTLELPKTIDNILKCKNPRCITSIEGYIPQKFYLVDRQKGEYRCRYCDEVYTGTDI